MKASVTSGEHRNRYHIKRGRGPAKHVKPEFCIAPKLPEGAPNWKVQTVIIRIYYNPAEKVRTRKGQPPKIRKVLSPQEQAEAWHEIKRYCLTHANGTLPTYSDGEYFIRIRDTELAWKAFQTFIGRCHLIGRKTNKVDLPLPTPEPEAFHLPPDPPVVEPPPRPRGRKSKDPK